ncbi:MAG TPA: tail fiber domain-containing protein [Phnomibacter sp.]|nr:tail fiber domain-containing protein [Phnomibacter sp.]
MNTTRIMIVLLLAVGSFSASIAQPVNNEPAGAITLTVVGSDAYNTNCTPSTTINWTGATLSPNSIGSCGWMNTTLDVWYKIIVPASGAYRVITAPADGVNPLDEGYQVSLAIANGSGVVSSYNDCSRYNEFEYPIVNTTGRTPNSTEYIRIWRQAGVPNGNLKICIQEVAPTAPSTQKVGIGIANPRANFDVNGNMHVQGNFTTLGRLGLGVTNPQSALELIGHIRLRGDMNNKNWPGIWFNRLDNSGNPPIHMGMQNDSIFGLYSTGGLEWSAFNMHYRTGLVSIAGGIKTPSMTGRFLIKKDPAAPANESPGIWLSRNDNLAWAGFMGMADDNAIGLYGHNGAGWGLTMNTATGNVGIGLGATAATSPLQFNNALNLTKISLYKGAYGDVGIGVYGGEMRLQNDIPNGKISMGVIQTDGSFSELAKAERNGNYAFSIFGSVWVNGTTYASDARFKKNIEPLQESLDKVLQMQGVSYDMKTEEFPNEHFDATHQVGLIAQDIEKIVPEVVSVGPNGYKAIDYAKLVPLLIESIKAQQAMLEKLQAEMDAMKKKK